MAKRTKRQRSEAAKESWRLRRLAAQFKASDVPPKLVPFTGAHGVTVDTPVSQPPKVNENSRHTLGSGVPHYQVLADELQAAYRQSAEGKGKERHANGKPFDRQPIMELARMYGVGFTAGQAAKKSQEALGMLARGERDKAIHELHGAIVYLAATAAAIREG